MTGLETFAEAVRHWAHTQLDDYNAELSANPGKVSGKEFNDPVWGTIVLRPIEVLLLDSPLVQRLRFIRQLGVVHLVYPAANHTRLEHSIGVTSQMERLIASINKDKEHVNADLRTVLRLTGLCHDVGHGAMSHVSENAMDNFEVVADLRSEFAGGIGAETVSFAEMVSYLILTSEPFGDLLTLAATKADERNLPKNAIELMANATIGKQISDHVPLLHELISGPFDADKLDYMTRDAHMTGVPVVTDMARLVQKVRAVEVDRERLPEIVARRPVGVGPTWVITGVSLSGARTLDELMFGRVLLQDKLYRHHKVRAAEVMVASMFRQFADLLPDGPGMAPYLLEDHQLMELTVEVVERLVGRDLTASERVRAKVAERLATMLKRRRLFVRAFAFAQSMPNDPYHQEPEQVDGLEEVARNSDDIEFRGELIGDVAAELERICELVAPELLAQFGPDLKPFLWLDPPLAPPDNSPTLRAQLIDEGRGAPQVLDSKAGMLGASRWSDAYLLTRETGYLFTASELSMYVYIAAEVVFRRNHKVRIPRSMVTYAKQDWETLSDIKRALAAKKYFDDLPSELRALPERLTRPDITERVAAVVRKLSAYEGPPSSQREKGLPPVSEQTVLDWVRQFDERHQDGPLELLERMRVVGRNDVIEALQRFFEDHGERFTGAAACPLGGPKDSSAITTYFANDLQAKVGIQAMSLPDALTSNRPIVFVEDFVGSGNQAISIIEAWLGVEPTTQLGEERGSPLSKDTQRGLRARPLGFVFAAGRADGAQRLSERLIELDLAAEVHVGLTDLPQAFEGNGTGGDQLRDDCEAVGRQLLDDGDERHDEDWRAERALGYGNDGFLTTFPYNTPTQALTCLWKAGEVDGKPWTPLLPRRPKR